MKWVERRPAAAASELTVDAHAEMIDLTSRIIGRILFGADMTTAPEQTRLERTRPTTCSGCC